MKKFYSPRLTRALKDIFTALTPREKTLLRMYVIDQSGIDPIGRTFGVHRATAARWLTAIRQQVFDDLRERAASDWGASTSDLRDLMAVLGGDIDLGLTSLLGEATVAGHPPAVAGPAGAGRPQRGAPYDYRTAVAPSSRRVPCRQPSRSASNSG